MKRFHLLFVNLLIVSGFIFTSCSNSDEEDALGITMSVVAGFIGPEGTAAVAAAGALSCAIYDPF